MSFPSGHSLVVSHNLDNAELVQTLATLARAQRIDGELSLRLRKSEGPGSPEPEPFMAAIVEKLDGVYAETIAVLVRNLDRWLKGQQMVKAMNQPPVVLNQAQIDELVALIRAHFTVVLRTGAPGWPANVYDRRWRELGLISPSVNVSSYIRDAFLAGKLHQVLTENSTYEAMRFAARGVQLTRLEALSLQTVQRDVALWFLQPVDQLVDEVTLAAQRQTNQVVRAVVAQYISGDLRTTPGDVSGLTPEELRAVEGSTVQGWKSLARELRNRVSASDAGRDWARVAATESRFAYNYGRLMSFSERGIPTIQWKVQPDACPYCRELLLNADGTPKTFTMGFMQEMLSLTDGTNYGRRAARIGRDGGWVPTAIIHPWCRCTPFPSGVLNA